jgi:cyclopropane fatty-acyl-phospholipid synthase-like methyltransferase
MHKPLSDYIDFKGSSLHAKTQAGRLPVNHFVEAYIRGEIDIVGDLMELMKQREVYFNDDITADQLKFAMTRLLPEVALHTPDQDKRIVQDHYDRGNDFFEAFLGPRMVYTSAFYRDLGDSLELAQDQKMELVCRKLLMKPGQRYLDIGCGWGTLARYAAKHFDVDSTGITIAEEQTAWGNRLIAEDGLGERARILNLDYRKIPNERWDRISCLEMAEHVGSKNFQKFMRQVYDLLEDDGLFYLQIAGPRRGARRTNLSFGLFMAKYIFPGADASRKLSWVVDQMERAGFEVHSIENVGVHYSHTIAAWYRNWLSREEQILETYGQRWYRIWQIFLAWASRVANDGQSTCFQLVLNKNVNPFAREVFIGQNSLGERMPMDEVERRAVGS